MAMNEPAGFSWDGPHFKSSLQYLTAEGYPLGTTCWYVVVEWRGWRRTLCGKTLEEAVQVAARWILLTEEEMGQDFDARHSQVDAPDPSGA